MNTNITLSTNVDDILQDSEIDVVIELMGGVEFAYTIAQSALKAKKAFITANKAMLAYHRSDIAPLANGLPVGFERVMRWHTYYTRFNEYFSNPPGKEIVIRT